MHPLINIARKQIIDGIRNNKPEFVPAVAYTIGEFGIEFISLVEWLISKYTRKLTYEGERKDGVSLATLSANYRNKTKLAMQIAIAKGIALMICFAGLPDTSTKKAYPNIN